MTDVFDPERRRFVQVAGTGLMGLMAGCTQKPSSDTGTGGPGGITDTGTGTAGGDTATVGGDTAAGGDTATTGGDTATAGGDTGTEVPPEPEVCTVTESDNEGPFWREDIPIRDDFDLYGDPGPSLTLSGKVTDVDCVPIAGAVIEFWHSDPTPVAVGDLTPADTVGYDTSSGQYKYYGQFATDANGNYSVHTKKPGWYLDGTEFRPSHIHAKVFVGGVEQLTTQIYFQGDPFIAGDSMAFDAVGRIISLSEDSSGALTGEFDITLA
jgi:protocatechuate 3,4-dioxygenase beta subunit